MFEWCGSMRIIVSGALPANPMPSIKNFAEDVGDSVACVDKGATPAVVTVMAGEDSGLAELLGYVSKTMRALGVAK